MMSAFTSSHKDTSHSPNVIDYFFKTRKTLKISNTCNRIKLAKLVLIGLVLFLHHMFVWSYSYMGIPCLFP
jgi:hypothetical protein